MGKTGKLMVLEGIDDVGKSTVGRELASVLRQGGPEVICHSFPGTISRTLGSHIYQLHHAPDNFNVDSINSSALQILHVAAHVDGILQHIIPSLERSDFVILDRYWWSTLAYGVATGACPSILNAALEAEMVAWSGISPTNLFLLTRKTGSAPENVGIDQREVLKTYDELVGKYQKQFPISIIPNDGSVSAAVDMVCEIIFNT